MYQAVKKGPFFAPQKARGPKPKVKPVKIERPKAEPIAARSVSADLDEELVRLAKSHKKKTPEELSLAKALRSQLAAPAPMLSTKPKRKLAGKRKRPTPEPPARPPSARSALSNKRGRPPLRTAVRAALPAAKSPAPEPRPKRKYVKRQPMSSDSESPSVSPSPSPSPPPKRRRAKSELSDFSDEEEEEEEEMVAPAFSEYPSEVIPTDVGALESPMMPFPQTTAEAPAAAVAVAALDEEVPEMAELEASNGLER